VPVPLTVTVLLVRAVIDAVPIVPVPSRVRPAVLTVASWGSRMEPPLVAWMLEVEV